MERFGNLQQTDIGTGQKANDSEHNQEHILPQSPVVSSQSRFVPEDNNFDNGWKHQSQCAQADSSDQRNERSEIRYGCGNHHGQDLWRMELLVIGWV